MLDLDGNIYDFGGSFSQVYKEKCSNCGKEIEISTQQDKNPEYYTDIYIKCDCGKSISFMLPVN